MERWDIPERELGLAELRVITGLVEAVPSLEDHMAGYLHWKEGDSSDGMQFMGELLRVCDRLADEPSNRPLLGEIFHHLETLAERLEKTTTEESLPAIDRAALDFLLFTFTDNPTGYDPEFVKLSPYMGPKIREMCTIC